MDLDGRSVTEPVRSRRAGIVRSMRPPRGGPGFALDGRVIGDRYRLETLLATGGMGQVWRGLDLVLGRPVAVKVLRGEHTCDAAALIRFRIEAQLSAGLGHPNIAALYDYGEVGRALGRGKRLAYLVMELVDGVPLSAVLRRDGRLAVERTLEIVRQATAGLAAAHAAGVVHRDVKPSNMLLGYGDTVKITDFGIAWSPSRDPLTGVGEVMGTAQYLSPEQAKGELASPASDVYALGIVAYECLAGRRPFEGERPVQVALMHMNNTPEPLPADVPPNVRQLVAQTLMKNPEDRFPDGAALLRAVNDVLAGRALSPPLDRNATTVLPPADHPLPAATGTVLESRHAASGSRPFRQLLIPLVALLTLGAVVAGLVFSSAHHPPAPVAGTTPTAALAVRVAAGDYVGRPAAEVATELTGLGLAVRLRAMQTVDAPDGAVLAVDPIGELSAGQTVTVTHAVPPPIPAEKPGGDAGSAAPSAGTPSPGSRGTATAAETAAAPETSAAPETTAGPGTPTAPEITAGPGNSGNARGIGGATAEDGRRRPEPPRD